MSDNEAAPAEHGRVCPQAAVPEHCLPVCKGIGKVEVEPGMDEDGSAQGHVKEGGSEEIDIFYRQLARMLNPEAPERCASAVEKPEVKAQK